MPMNNLLYILKSIALVVLSPAAYVGVIMIAIVDLSNSVYRKSKLMPRLKAIKYVILVVILFASIVGLIFLAQSIVQILHPEQPPLIGSLSASVSVALMLIVSALPCVFLVFAILLHNHNKIMEIQREQGMATGPDAKRTMLIIFTAVFGGLACLAVTYYILSFLMTLFVNFLNV